MAKSFLEDYLKEWWDSLSPEEKANADAAADIIAAYILQEEDKRILEELKKL
jgi:hypothetical protein